MPSTFGTAVEQGGSSGWDVLTAIATAAGVLATVAAVVVALYLAKQGDRTRVREASARATAQARLVQLAEPNWVIGAIDDADDPAFVGLVGSDTEYNTRFRFTVDVLNASDRPILGLAMRLWIDDFATPAVTSDRRDTLSAHEHATLTVRAVHAQGPVGLRVSWIDADGRCWHKDVLQTHDDPQEPLEGQDLQVQPFRDYNPRRR